MTVAVVVHIPVEGVGMFQEYERAVLPLLSDHGGVLAHRWRNGDGTHEVHILEFESSAGFDSYLSDERRAPFEPSLEASGASSTIHEVDPVSG